MSQTGIKKMALIFALFSFAILTFGSVLSGSRILTALIRGTEGALLFGLVAWFLGNYILEEKTDAPPEEIEGEQKGAHLDETA